ncbi:Methyltransferase type 11 domain protein [Candidatus Omnitrophus magneticus]|uniref:Methyltransferase type 11 domain protein n=1 Tax=Candidatus Omnitrophus magneticus TaxID=1609969 RepID=A0A0F0CNW3_9BACT|nr:Methyltransferase type 11 domain protein [Candidatus Omnitrophus magneticus]
MRSEKNTKIDQDTKMAWEKNWEEKGLPEIMEIFDYPRVSEQMEIFLKYLPRDKRILEGGCGLGPYLIKLKSLGYNIIGIDYNLAPLKEINKYDSSNILFCANVENLPFPDNYFGAYLSLGVIEHFTAGPVKAVKEAFRVLEKNGIFLVKIPRTSIFERISYPLTFLKKNKTIRKFFGKEEKFSYWEQHFDITEISGILKQSGFDILDIIPMDQEHALIAYSSMFRDKLSYDGANKLGIKLAVFCKNFLPWATASDMILICKKK